MGQELENECISTTEREYALSETSEKGLGELLGFYAHENLRPPTGLPFNETSPHCTTAANVEHPLEGCLAGIPGTSPFSGFDLFAFADSPDDIDAYVLRHFGHGLNSYLLEYVRVAHNRRVLFHIPWGGVYTDNEQVEEQLSAFLTWYAEFETEVVERGGKLIAIDGTEWGGGRYCVLLPDCPPLRLSGSAFDSRWMRSTLADFVQEGIARRGIHIDFPTSWLADDDTPHPVGQNVHEQRYSTSELRARGPMVDGIPEGEWVRYYPLGSVKQTGSYDAGERHGAWKAFDPAGDPKWEYHYEHDVRHGPFREWDFYGQVEAQGTYDDGERLEGPIDESTEPA